MPLHHMGFSGTGQPASANQGSVTLTIGSAVSASGAITGSGAYGFTETQANALVVNSNLLRTDVTALATLVNQLRSDLVTLGLVKGGA